MMMSDEILDKKGNSSQKDLTQRGKVDLFEGSHKT